MKKASIYFSLLVVLFTSCKKQLDVGNPNSPTLDNAKNESGIISLASGGVYLNGFNNLKYYDGVSGAFWAGATGYQELMGDIICTDIANEYMNQIGAPSYVILDDGTKVVNPNAPAEQIDLIRQINHNSYQANNTLYYEWAYMYNLNNACNNVLSLLDGIAFTGDAATKKSTVLAWCYWWKGFAYSRIGSLYYAGLINDAANTTNAKYVTKEAIIAEANANLDKAAGLLSGITGTDAYTDVLKSLIPDYFQTGKGFAPTTDMWLHSINTLKARNILVNTPVATMTAEQWTNVLKLVGSGVGSGDYVFTGRTNGRGDFISASSGTVAAKSTGPQGNATYKISERLIQDFNTGDQRLANNFTRGSTWLGPSDRGNSFNTRWQLVDGGNGIANTIVYSDRTAGNYELYLASTYEENELMKAEALLYQGSITAGLASIDNVRKYQGAGLGAVSGTITDPAAAKEELRKERRVALAFRGFAFYDARRWGVINDVAAGGGRKGAVVVDKAGKVSTNATINYNFLDYWDVPDNELAYNPAAAGSAPIKNPK